MKAEASETVRLDVFVSKIGAISRSCAKNIIEDGGVTVNGIVREKSGAELKFGDVVEFAIPEPKKIDVAPADIPLDIVYEDDSFAVINKPHGMVVHQASSYTANDTLVNALLANLNSLSGINGVIRPGIVHRLDKDTSGLIVVAKNDTAHKSLAVQIEKKTARRIYYALCDGVFKDNEGTVDQPLARSKRDRKKISVDPNGRRAVTHYCVVENFSKFTLVRFELETGRTHQIRVHAAFIHHPIVGDGIYGGSTAIFKNGQLLHAGELVLSHPETGERMVFKCPLPDYFEEVLNKLRKIK